MDCSFHEITGEGVARPVRQNYRENLLYFSRWGMTESVPSRRILSASSSLQVALARLNISAAFAALLLHFRQRPLQRQGRHPDGVAERNVDGARVRRL
jgi:hypothetical protein